MKRDGTFFGSTILGKDLVKDQNIAGPAAVNCLEEYMQLGIFGNKADSMGDLETVLGDLFDEVEVWQSGYCGVWKAQGPKII